MVLSVFGLWVGAAQMLDDLTRVGEDLVTILEHRHAGLA